MKRNLDLIKEILIDMEDTPGMWNDNFTIEGYSKEEIEDHLILMEDANLITGEFNRTSDGALYSFEVRMTNDGHDYITMARNKGIWNKLKNTIKEKGMDLPIEVTKLLLISYTKELFNLDK